MLCRATQQAVWLTRARPSCVQLFFKRSTIYVPFVLVGAYFANEVSTSAPDPHAADPAMAHGDMAYCCCAQAVDTAINGFWESRNKGVSRRLCVHPFNPLFMHAAAVIGRWSRGNRQRTRGTLVVHSSSVFCVDAMCQLQTY